MADPVTPRRWTLVVLGTAALFAGLALLVRSGAVSGPDHAAVATADAWSAAHPDLRSFWKFVSRTLQPLTWEVLCGLAAVGLLVRGHWRPAAATVTAITGAMTTSTYVKVIVARPRPTPVHVLAHAAGYSFPSGHTTAAATAMALVALYALRRGRGLPWVPLGCAAVAALVAASRIGLAVHYPTDVLAGGALGLFWATLSCGLWRCEAAPRPA